MSDFGYKLGVECAKRDIKDNGIEWCLTIVQGVAKVNEYDKGYIDYVNLVHERNNGSK